MAFPDFHRSRAIRLYSCRPRRVPAPWAPSGRYLLPSLHGNRG